MRLLTRLLLFLLLTAPVLGQSTLEQGSKLPTLPEVDFRQLAGPKGLVLVVFRSADW